MTQNVIAFFRSQRRNHSNCEDRLITRLLKRIRSRFVNLSKGLQAINQRHTLSQLSDRQLQDIGLTRFEVGGHSNFPVYDIPSNRVYEYGAHSVKSVTEHQPFIDKLQKD